MTDRTTPRPRVVTARIPGSKSITNRALLLAACAEGTSRLRAPLVSDDTRAFRDAVVALGARVTATPDDAVWEATGTGRGPVGGAEVWCADAGTAARFLPPFAATGHGEYLFDGSGQLRARPLHPLTDALDRLGTRVTAAPGGGLPLRLLADGARGGALSLDGTLSSQYLSGLLMAAPLMRTPLTVRVRGLVSRPYLELTVTLMRHFGARVHHEAPAPFAADGTAEDVLHISPGGYRPADLPVEPDASTASYVFAAAAVTGRSVTVPGLGRGSVQGDLRFAELLRRMDCRVEVTDTATTVTGAGRLRGGFTVDMGDISDTFMTLAVIAPLADASVTIRGIGHARLKESDRVAAVTENLRVCGVRVDTGRDWLTVHPAVPRPARIACRRDHRIAMAFSVLGLRVKGITLDDPACVAKTFPGFHSELLRLGFTAARTA